MVGVDDLPHQVWIEILSRLSVKTILRCRSVCKSLYSVISGPDFISDYSSRNLNKNGNRLLLHLYDLGSHGYSFSSLDKSFMESHEHDDVSELLHRGGIRVVGSCNGLICLSSARSSISFFLWNPTIRKIVELPPFYTRKRYPSHLGFGFDSKTNDYKVLCIVAFSGRFDEEHVCDIFDLKKGVWRAVSPWVGSSRCIGGHTQDYYLNGAVHWNGKSSDGVIFSFDVRDEVVREIRMPNGDDGDGHICIRSVAFDGLIHAIVCKTEHNGHGYIDVSQSCSVWVMKEYGVTESWTRAFNIDLQSAQVWPNSRLSPNCIRLWGNGEVLMHEWGNGEVLMHAWDYPEQGLVLYHAGRIKCKRLLSPTKGIANLCLYEESLSLM